ncbi:hypothetical protein CEUSTIGMA_g7102.t1 [Chlamydomonas eustigma]|uniref:Uncharacterized protein n=1 Tax=Chlamydomonas eustigma TaxID=1157962 RepID=A0A250X9B7_9CHLO|nr:hypothetical protein CEUSTIGMA_g7102.t1 [Chlamydomonas eustigma]|eukprot:GAX79661.1 hypothetical protein CEUSTIGMA_g7102.t1 [Chlamydomonas eustigma]
MIETGEPTSVALPGEAFLPTSIIKCQAESRETAAEFYPEAPLTSVWSYQEALPDGRIPLQFSEALQDADPEEVYAALQNYPDMLSAQQEQTESHEFECANFQMMPDRSRSIRHASVEGRLQPISILLLVVGTRGDIQPFIGIGLKLKEYGHRIRIASHKVYREFVTGFGLEFYPIGGDPKVMSEFVVKNRGILPGSLNNMSEALKQREQVRDIMFSTWDACVSPDPENPGVPFTADAIVANPPAYGHTHCAEKLNVPLHIVFTMPWTPTKSFPSPFARIRTDIGGNSTHATEMMNWLSYFAVEDVAWLGMSDMVKEFRDKFLQLKGFGPLHSSHAIYYSKIPITYIWSPSLVPRPPDWPTRCEVVGFVNVELTKLTQYTPPKDIQDFLDAGPPPVYIGFGSLVVGDPKKLTEYFVGACELTGLRAIIQKGWGGLGEGYGEGGKPIPEDILFIGVAPHDWLFRQCCAVVHHGGAGTTACGLYSGKPTFIVPFFGDQPFWGAACHSAGVGPQPVPIDELNTVRILEAFKILILPLYQKTAIKVQQQMLQEDGVQGTVDHLHQTIYGALFTSGRTFKWDSHELRPGPSNGIYQGITCDLGRSLIKDNKSEASPGLTGGASMVDYRCAELVHDVKEAVQTLLRAAIQAITALSILSVLYVLPLLSWAALSFMRLFKFQTNSSNSKSKKS